MEAHAFKTVLPESTPTATYAKTVVQIALSARTLPTIASHARLTFFSKQTLVSQLVQMGNMPLMEFVNSAPPLVLHASHLLHLVSPAL